MEQIWFNRIRTAGTRRTFNWNRSGVVNVDVNGSGVYLSAFSSYFDPPSTSFSATRSSFTTDNYATFTAVSIPTLNSDRETLAPFASDASSGGTLAWFSSENNPFYLNNSLQTIGFSYTTDFLTATPVNGYELPDVQTNYLPTTTYTAGSLAGLGSGLGTATANYTLFPTTSQVSQDQIVSGTTRANYARFTAHTLVADNTTRSLSWGRSGYNTGIQITLPPGTPPGMGRAVFPIDMIIGALPAPTSYINPGGTTFPGKQAVVGERIFFNPGCVKSTADIVRTNNGTGATKNGLGTFTGYLYAFPPADPTSGQRNNLPLVLEVSVVAGVVTGVTNIISYGAGFTAGTSLVNMTWDQNEDKYNTVTVNNATTVAAYTQTTAPQFTITFYNNYAPLRYITMDDTGDGYNWTGSAWDGVRTKETPWGANSRTYTLPATPGTVTWSSPATGTSGTLMAVPTGCWGSWACLCPADACAYAYSPSSAGGGPSTGVFPSATAGPIVVNPKLNLFRLRPQNFNFPGGFQSGLNSPIWGMSQWNKPFNAYTALGAVTPSYYYYVFGKLAFSNDAFQTTQWITLPGVYNQPLLPRVYDSVVSTSVQTASRLFYTTVPDTDPLIVVPSNGPFPTGVGSNMYVFALHCYGEWDPVTPANSVYRYKLVMYHFAPGPDLNNLIVGSTWTLMQTFPEFTSSGYIVWADTARFSPNMQVSFSSNANWSTNTPPTEAIIQFSANTSPTTSIATPQYCVTFSSETSITVIPTPTTLPWTPTGAPVAMNYDVVNNRYIVAQNMATTAWPGYAGSSGGAYVLLNTGDSLFSTSPTVTYLSNTETTPIWPG